MGLACLPTLGVICMVNVGKYTMDGWYGNDKAMDRLD